jgi:hypothetical protein
MVGTKVLEVKIEFDSGQKANLELIGDVIILVHSKEDVVALLLKAVNLYGITSVKLNKNGSYEGKEITTGSYDNENIEIRCGLKEVDTVFLSNSN